MKSTCVLQTWQERVPVFESAPDAPFASIFVPTVDSVCAGWFVRASLAGSRPFLITGPQGAGKTRAVQHALAACAADMPLDTATLALSAQTSAETVQRCIEGALEKHGPGRLGAGAGRRVAVFVDDINMPQCGRYGAQAPLELLRLLQVRHSRHHCTVLRRLATSLTLRPCSTGNTAREKLQVALQGASCHAAGSARDV